MQNLVVTLLCLILLTQQLYADAKTDAAFWDLLKKPKTKTLAKFKKLCDLPGHHLGMDVVDRATEQVVKMKNKIVLEAFIYADKCTDGGGSEGHSMSVSQEILFAMPLETIQTVAKLRLKKESVFKFGMDWGNPDYYGTCNQSEGGGCTEDDKKKLIAFEQKRIDAVKSVEGKLKGEEKLIGKYLIDESQKQIEFVGKIKYEAKTP